MSNSLLTEFNPVTAKQWKQKIQFDLKGVDYKTLLTQTNEGVIIKPFYHQDDGIQIEVPQLSGDFSSCQSIFVSNEKTANFIAKDALKRGADSILFEASEPFDSAGLLKGLVTQSEGEESLEIHFKLSFLSEDFLLDLIKNAKGLLIYLNLDIIGNFSKTGNWFYSKEKDYAVLKSIIPKAQIKGSVLSVDTSLYQNAGANIVQQVAYALAHGNEYLNQFKNVIKSDSQESLNQIQFYFSVGSNYFFEIAKLRAFRVLWQLVLDEYKLNIQSKLFVTPSLRNKTLYDYNVNMLRTTTECMSAILGGADTISNSAYDCIYHKKNEFGERISRNQLLILKEESYFKDANQFAEGSYYIETLTSEIAEKALVIFKNIENSGGFLKQLFEGTIQRKIEESAQKEQKQFNSDELILLGVNKYTNSDDMMKDSIELYPFVKTKPRKTLIKPIIPKRLAEEIEKERLEKE